MRSRRVKELPGHKGFNMTPMIDIVFQLIVFFLLVADMTSRRDDPLVLPVASTGSVFADLREIRVNVGVDGRTRVSGRTLSEDALTSLLETRAPGTPVLIRADRSTPFEHVQKVLMMARDPEHSAPVRFAARKE